MATVGWNYLLRVGGSLAFLRLRGYRISTGRGAACNVVAVSSWIVGFFASTRMLTHGGSVPDGGQCASWWTAQLCGQFSFFASTRMLTHGGSVPDWGQR